MAIIPNTGLSPIGWEPGTAIGVPGGIDQYLDGSGHANERPTSGAIDITASPYSADPTGAVNMSTILADAVAAAGTNGVVYLPPGLYKSTAATALGFQDRYTIRGAGSSKISTSPVAVGTGTKVFTVMSSGPWVADAGILIRKWDNPEVYMMGTVTSYSGTTLTVNVATVGGSGTYSKWKVGVTTIISTGTRAIQVGSTDTDYLATGTQIIDSYTSIAAGTGGDTSITPTDASSFSIGDLVLIRHKDNTDSTLIAAGVPPIFQYAPGDYWFRLQVSLITNKVGSVLTIDPPLISDFPTELTPRAWALPASRVVMYVGIETLDIVGIGSAATNALVAFQQCYGCWLYDCNVELTPNRQVEMIVSARCEVRKCHIGSRTSSGSNGAAIIFGTSAACLFEDNNLFTNFPIFEANGSIMGCAILFNNCEQDGDSGFQLNINHGAHNSYNLYEGNVANDIKADSYFGSQSNDTIFRNWAPTITSLSVVYGGSIALRRFSTYNNIVGNIVGQDAAGDGTIGDGTIGLGLPNITSPSSSGTSNMVNGDFPLHWLGVAATITTRTGDFEATITFDTETAAAFQHPNYLDSASGPIHLSHTSGTKALLNGTMSGHSGSTVHVTFGTSTGNELPAVGQPVRLWGGIYGYQELNEDTYRIEDGGTTFQKGNYIVTGGVGAQESLGGDTMPDSLAYSAQPTWWPTSIPWPAFDPASPTYSVQRIPAGYRWVNGEDAFGVSPPDFSPAQGTYSTTQNVTISCSTPGATIYYTTNGNNPTVGSPVYSSPVAISSTTTLKAFAVKSGLADSLVSSGTYIIGSYVADPSFSPSAGSYEGTQSVSISTATSGSTIRYTTDGSTPSQIHGTVYSASIGIAATTTVKAIAYKSGLFDSSVVSAAYTITTPSGGGAASAGNLTATVFNLSG